MGRCAVSLAILLLASCATVPKGVREIPGPAWPALPDPSGRVFYLEESAEVPAGMIVMGAEFWLALAEYVQGVEEIHKQLEDGLRNP
jgi:hypothetical protein